MKVVVRKSHVLPAGGIVAVFATIQNWMQLRGPETAIAMGLGAGAAMSALVWVLAHFAERKQAEEKRPK